jgi:hypothetical protein
MTDYQSNISKSLMIKGRDNQAQISKCLCLIIKGFDNQAQEPYHQINQYLKKSLIDTIYPSKRGIIINFWVSTVCVSMTVEKSYVERTWDLFASCWFGGVNKILKTSLKEITEKYQALFPGKGAGGVKS